MTKESAAGRRKPLRVGKQEKDLGFPRGKATSVVEGRIVPICLHEETLSGFSSSGIKLECQGHGKRDERPSCAE